MAKHVKDISYFSLGMKLCFDVLLWFALFASYYSYTHTFKLGVILGICGWILVWMTWKHIFIVGSKMLYNAFMRNTWKYIFKQ